MATYFDMFKRGAANRICLWPHKIWRSMKIELNDEAAISLVISLCIIAVAEIEIVGMIYGAK